MSTAIVPGLVSTIIPVHNRPALLREAVASVLAQTYRPIEIVVVDDGSTDDTPAVADALAAAHPEVVRVLHKNNAGPGLAREAGRQTALGEFIQYLDSDDVLMPRKFELQVMALRQRQDCGVAYGKTNYRVLGLGNDLQPWKRTGERIDWMFPSLLESRWWGTSTPLYRRALTDEAGPWLGLTNEEDWEYDCRIAANGVRLVFVDEFVSEERDHAGSRLSHGGSVSPAKLSSRAAAHSLVMNHALRARIPPGSAEMQHFARELFLLSRQCGAAGLAVESRELFQLAKTASTEDRRRGLDFALYGICANLLGWSLTGRLACFSDRLRK